MKKGSTKKEVPKKASTIDPKPRRPFLEKGVPSGLLNSQKTYLRPPELEKLQRAPQQAQPAPPPPQPQVPAQHWIRRQIEGLRPTSIIFFDSSAIMQIIAYHVEKRAEFWKFRALLADGALVFLTTETTRAEVTRKLHEQKIQVKWEQLFPSARTFHVISGLTDNHKRQRGSDLMKLPPFGSHLTDAMDASAYFEAVMYCSILRSVHKMKFVTNNHILVCKCQMNPVWVSMLCNNTDYLAVQRFTSNDSNDNALVEFPDVINSSAKEELLLPFRTLGFLDENYEAVLHTNFSFGPVHVKQAASAYFPIANAAPQDQLRESSTFSYPLAGATPWALFDGSARPWDDKKQDAKPPLVEKKMDKFYFFVVDGIEKELFVNEPMACELLKEQLFKLQLVQVELLTEFSLVSPSTMQPFRPKEIVPFGTCIVEKHPPSEDLPGTQERLAIHWLRRVQRDINAKTVYVLDAQTIVQLAKATLTKDHKFHAIFQALDCAFITTETTRLEVLRILKKENILVRWDLLLPLARTFHVVTDSKLFKKYEAAGNILRLPPYGCRDSDFVEAAMYMEAVVCGTALVKGDLRFLSCNNYVLIQKCHLNPMWLRTLCSSSGLGEPVAIQRFISRESAENPLVLLSQMPNVGEDDLTSPFRTQGFVDDRLQAVLHTNLEGNQAFLPLTYLACPTPHAAPPFAAPQVPYFAPEPGGYGVSAQYYAPAYVALYPLHG